jgi:flavodoxin
MAETNNNGSVEEGSDAMETSATEEESEDSDSDHEKEEKNAKVSTVAEEDNDNDSDDESLSQTGKPSAKAKLAAELETGRRLKELENLQQAAIALADHREKIEKQVLKDNGIEVTLDSEGNAKGKRVYPRP